MNELREQIIAILAKYICDAKCQVFHSHDDVFLADQILSLEPIKTLLEKLEQAGGNPERLVDIERILNYIRENCMQTEGCAGYLVCERDLQSLKDKEEGK